jgi:hypothetical protein
MPSRLKSVEETPFIWPRMNDLFNPAGLCMLEDRQGAIAFGYVAPRVFFARFVGRLSAELGEDYVHHLEAAVGRVPALAYFADASALREYDLAARAHFARFVAQRRPKFASLVILTWAEGAGTTGRAFGASIGEPVEVLSDPLEFECAFSNVASPCAHPITEVSQVWQVHAPA